ncbi:hypothetical protein XB05_19260 [Xanthomonas arboricola]|uniref:SDR family NAD(P)-dependent oxidoreductase n=1 Tax=Xanthomonas arboricola TaxID=56448 RepID=UPI00061A30A5|nr:SDR family NAD(P)-dependent oxidoreductase [Xanthomonas arboricola]AKC80638.1 hypothetical protein XB05_19260 [Xanthomonas arboricola]
MIAGSAVGIGAEIAKELARQGATVALSDINPDNGAAMLQAITAEGGKGKSFLHDVASWDSSSALAEQVERQLGPIAILVNNAGVSKRVPLLEIPEAEWDRMLDINLKGQFLTTRAIAPHMVEQQYGRIINLSSVTGKKGFADFSHYCASKFGVLGLTQSLAVKFATSAITVNAVCPGIAMTPLHDKIVEEMAAAAGTTVDEAITASMGNVQQKGPQTALDIARTVAFLVSDAAVNMTRGSYHVDGGMVKD